jgi:hypothetical protein
LKANSDSCTRINAYARIDGTWSTVLSSEVNDLTTSVTWADVPDVNITQSSVTQHQSALSITESQISDLQSYYLTSNPANYIPDAPANGNPYARQDGTWTLVVTNEANDLTASVTWANVPDVNITQSSVTQHQSALSITESQISDLQTYYLATNSFCDLGERSRCKYYFFFCNPASSSFEYY